MCTIGGIRREVLGQESMHSLWPIGRSRPEAAVQADRLRLPSSCGIVLKRELTAKRASAILPCGEHEAVADLA
jgi:hypothetical protein